jgi:hypothetical protein
MDAKITGKNLKDALGADIDALLDEVAKTMNAARAGKIIADSEEGVRDAAAEFRRRLYEKALALRQQQDGAFSPSADRRADSLAQQGPADHQLSDDQRTGGDSANDLLEPRRRKRRSR